MTYDPLKTRTKYIHINSKHRHESEHDEARMKVHMHTPLKNVHSVAVKKFSMANGFHNISSRANDILQRANEQMEWNKSQLEAQNLILKELYNIRIK